MTLQRDTTRRAVCDLRGVASAKTNIVRGAPFLVGRGEELREIAAKFEGGAQLVTITGAAGVGKTCVAVRFASEEHSAWYSAPGAGGVWVCELRGIREVTFLCALVGEALGLSSRGERISEEMLARVLSRRGQILLVLDDAEMLTRAARDALQGWLRAAPRARILATSRVALGIAGEVQVPLAPLELPNFTTHGANLPGVVSVELFLIRARRADPELVARPEDLGDIAEVVRKLQGIPLAIELTAARVATLPIGEIHDRLGKLLARRPSPEDAGSDELLRTVIADACTQLGVVEDACLVASAVFAGGFTLAAIEAVLGMSDPSVLSALANLHALSLIRATRFPGFGGELRFSLHEAIHDHQVRRLAASPELAATLAERHAGFYAEVGHLLVRQATVEGDADPLVCLGHELENILLAHTFALADTRPRSVIQALHLAFAADLVLTRRGVVAPRWQLLDSAVVKAQVADSVLRVDVITAMLARGRASLDLGRIQEARADFEVGFTLARQAGSEQHKAAALLRLGELAAVQGSPSAACEALSRALDFVVLAWGPLARLCKAEIHARLARTYRREGDLSAAASQIRSAIHVHRMTNQAEGLAAALYEAAIIFIGGRRHDDALILIDEGLAVGQSRGTRSLVGALLTARGECHHAGGSLDLALEDLVRAAGLAHRVGDGQREVEALYSLARVLIDRYQRRDALRVIERALILSDTMGGVQPIGHPERLDPRVGREGLLALRGAITRTLRDGADDPGANSLRIRVGARAFRPPRALRDIDLRRRIPLCRILLALARKRIESPGERLALDEVFAAGWPGEVLGKAGRINRVNVALTALRTLGLRAFLSRGPWGYALTLSYPCELDESN